jgi:putative CocE/NonD family hydrolase
METGAIDLLWGIKIPMRDGVALNATVYKTRNEPSGPVIFALTPYIADSDHARALWFAQNGYTFALVDCRGRGNSAGQFEPFINESRDAHDIVEWLAVQSWCDGVVTMWGGSYLGMVQWMAAKALPAHLKTIVPVAAGYAAVDFPFYKNIFISYIIQWLTLTSGVTGNAGLFREQSFWIGKFRERYLSNRPFCELDRIAGNETTLFQTWLQHPTADDYWDNATLTRADYDRIDIPILTITGHYDDDQPGALHYYREHMASASPAKDRHYLIIGPWDHSGTRTPAREFGGLTVSEAAMLDMNQLHCQWYDWILKGAAKPAFLQNRVAYYVMAAGQWKYADSLDAIANGTKRFYLDSVSGANDVFNSGILSETAPSRSAADSYRYDPLDLRPAELEQEVIDAYLSDQRYALNLYGNGLIYHTAAFAEELEISGCVTFIAWITLDVADTDFQVLLYEILHDGTSVLLTQDLLRARYRESCRREKPVTPGAICHYRFEGFTFFSRRIGTGSRLRLLLKSPNSIYLQKNYNSGGIVAEESGDAARTARVILHHDAAHPSYLELPVVKLAAL